MSKEEPLYAPGPFAALTTDVINCGWDTREVSEFFCDDRYLDLIKPYQEQTPLHRFISWLADDVLYFQTTEYDLPEQPTKGKKRRGKTTQVLPLEAAFRYYGFEDAGFEEFSDKTLDEADEDDVYDYVSEMRLAGWVEELGDKIAEQVFPIVFKDRAVMKTFNELLAVHVSRAEMIDLDVEDSLLFERAGQLRVLPPPNVARGLVFDRERGLCAYCGTPIAKGKCAYVQLAPATKGGTNDVTNLEARCMRCAAKP